MGKPNRIIKGLERAKELLQIGWCQDSMCRTPKGDCENFRDKNISEWGLDGAIMRAAYEIGNNQDCDSRDIDLELDIEDSIEEYLESERGIDEHGRLRLTLNPQYSQGVVVDLNDTQGQTQKGLINIIDKTIEMVKSKEKNDV